MSDTATSAPAAPAAAPAAPAAPAVPAAPAAPQAPAPAAPQAPPVTPPVVPPAGEPQDVASLPAWAQKLITDTRNEAAAYRTRAQGAAPQGDPNALPAPPAPPVPAPAAEGDVTRLPQWAQRAVTDGQGAARQLAVQTAVLTAAPAAGADIARLLDSQSAMTALAAVDPTDTAAVTAAITAAITAQPYLATQTGGPARGGVEFGTPASTEVTPAQFAAMDYAARTALFQTDPTTYRRLAG